MNIIKSFLLLFIFLCIISCKQESIPIPESFVVEEEFNLQLVASEPLIMDPVDLEFNENGEALVLEMPGYPFEDRQSRIMLLLDSDGDGMYDDSQVYAETLQLASSILPYKKGVLVAAPPYLLYLSDNDGDRKAEAVDTLIGGFSTGNLQHNYNGLTFGLDGWIYAANGGNSGKPYWWNKSSSELDLRGQDLRIDIENRVIERIGRSSGGYELAVDEWGRIYETHNLEHISLLVFPGRYIGDHNLTPGHSLINVSDHEDNGLSRIYPVGEQETRVNHPEQSGYFSGSCGITYYGGGAFGEEYNNSVWVTDVVLNLIHVDKITPSGSGFTASRILDKKEFLASSDRSSRPVNMTVGPEGAIYLVDMYREVIEHPEWIPDEIEETMDLHAGKDKGRIYKITKGDGKSRTFSNEEFSSVKGLVAALAHSNQWVRNTAHRLLLERKQESKITTALTVAITSDNAMSRLHALWILHRNGSLTSDQLLHALGDDQNEIRENALIMAEDHLQKAEEIIPTCIDMLLDNNQRVRMQAALTISTLGSVLFKKYEEQILTNLARAASMPMDKWNIASFTLAAAKAPENLLSNLNGNSDSNQELMTSLAKQCGDDINKAEKVLEYLYQVDLNEVAKVDIIDALTSGINDLKGSKNLITYVVSLEEDADMPLLAATTRLRNSLGLPASQTFVNLSRQVLPMVADIELADSLRLSYLDLIDLLPYRNKEKLLFQCLNNKQSIAIQEAALDQLWAASDPLIGNKLVDLWKELGPQARKRASDILLYKKTHHDALLTGLENEDINIGEMNFDLERRRMLLWWTDDENTKKRAELLFSDSGVVNRKEAMERMRPALSLKGNIEHGAVVFNNICSQCHIYGDIGKEVGPVLTEINRKSKESLLHDILDPNAASDTKYINHRVETIDGVTHVGMVDQETDREVTIRQIGGATITIRKSQIKEFSSLGSSLMMEGLEAGMSTQDMADLLAYLTNLNQ